MILVNRKTLSIATLLVAGFILAGSVSAYHFMGMGRATVSNETTSAMDQALENNDYQSFVSARDEYLLKAFAVTEDEFNKMAVQHASQQDIRDAVKAGNYTEWETLMQANPSPLSSQLLTNVTADNFHLLQELEDARAADDSERVQEIMDELGLEKGFRGMTHRGMHGNPFAMPAMGHSTEIPFLTQTK